MSSPGSSKRAAPSLRSLKSATGSMYSARSILNNQNLSGFNNIVNIRPGQNNRRTKNARSAKPVAPAMSQNTYAPKFKMVAVTGPANSPAQWVALKTNAGGAGGTVPTNFFNLYGKNYLNKTNAAYQAKRTLEVKQNAPKYIQVNFPLPPRDVKRIRRAFGEMNRILLEVRDSLRSLLDKRISPAERGLTTQYLLDVYKYVSKVRVQETIWFTEIAKTRPHAAELVNFPLTPMHAPYLTPSNRLRFKQNAGTVFASRQLQNLLNRIGDHYIRVTETLNARRTLSARRTIRTVPKTAAPNGMARNIRTAGTARNTRTAINARNGPKPGVRVNAKIPTVPSVPMSSRWVGRFRRAPTTPSASTPTPSAQQSWFQRLKQLNARRLMPRMVSR